MRIQDPDPHYKQCGSRFRIRISGSRIRIRITNECGSFSLMPCCGPAFFLQILIHLSHHTVRSILYKTGKYRYRYIISSKNPRRPWLICLKINIMNNEHTGKVMFTVRVPYRDTRNSPNFVTPQPCCKTFDFIFIVGKRLESNSSYRTYKTNLCY